MRADDRSFRKNVEDLLAAAAEIWPGQVGVHSVPVLLDTACRRVTQLRAGAPEHRRRMNRKLFSMGIPTLALYRTLRQDAGFDQEPALELLDRTLHQVYERRLASPVLRKVASGAFRLRVVREGIMRAAESLDEPEGFSMRRVPSPGTLLAFDVERCPLAEFFARHGAPEVGPLICKIDDLVTDALSGVTLERTGTIAAGASRCDFRYRRTP
ncbi:MAG: L-2-amino-thiazoline-4-carboxylic acid hydrolase [Myxococcota bacterium]